MGRGAGKIPASAFTFTAQGELFCPMEKPLSLAEKRQEGGRIRKIYQAKTKVCRSCKQKRKCLGHGASGKSGRRVSFLCGEALPSNADPEQTKGAERLEPGAGAIGAASKEPRVGLIRKPMGRLPIYLVDLEATELRRKLSMDLRRQQVEIEITKSRVSEEPEESILTRDQVAHRRLTWVERLARNASKPSGPSWFVQLYGIPEAIKVFFINSDDYQAAA